MFHALHSIAVPLLVRLGAEKFAADRFNRMIRSIGHDKGNQVALLCNTDVNKGVAADGACIQRVIQRNREHHGEL